jgi:antitoxin component of MazEF toxin-antitoxin module
MSWAATAVAVAGMVYQGVQAAQDRKRKESKAKMLQAKLDSLERNRQAIINPWENVTSLAGMAQDLSSLMTNPMANLGVATQAAEIQMEQSDIALANTLDTLRSTGSSAGGATALAQAALASKKQIAAGIEKQEAQNEKLRAQGEARLEERTLAEKLRLQQLGISEGQRVQAAEAQGKQFVFTAQEQRERDQMARIAALMSNTQAAANQAQADQTAAFTGAFTTIASSAATQSGN